MSKPTQFRFESCVYGGIGQALLPAGSEGPFSMRIASEQLDLPRPDTLAEAVTNLSSALRSADTSPDSYWGDGEHQYAVPRIVRGVIDDRVVVLQIGGVAGWNWYAGDGQVCACEQDESLEFTLPGAIRQQWRPDGDKFVVWYPDPQEPRARTKGAPGQELSFMGTVLAGEYLLCHAGCPFPILSREYVGEVLHSKRPLDEMVRELMETVLYQGSHLWHCITLMRVCS